MAAFVILPIKGVGEMLKKAVRDAWGLVKIGLWFTLFSIPTDWLMGRPLLNGFVKEWLAAETESRWAMTGILLLLLVIIWGGFILICLAFRAFNQQIAKHDWVNRKH